MEDDQQFCLRWNNHQSTLISVFDTLLEKGVHVDCTLAAEGCTLNAHKVVLSACSPYFEAVLGQQYDKHPIIILKDVKFAELRAMMDYMYRGEVNISQDQLGALLKAAESLQIKGLSDNKPQPRKEVVAEVAAVAAPAVALPAEDRDRESSGDESPSRRKRKRRKASRSPTPPPHPAEVAPAEVSAESTSCDPDTVQPKAEFPDANDDSVEDLTVDEEMDSDGDGDESRPPDHTSPAFANWQSDRSRDESGVAQDGPRDSQGVASLEMGAIVSRLRKISAVDITATLLPDSLSRNNNAVIAKSEQERRPFQKRELDSEEEYYDFDDILLPDESEVYGGAYSGEDEGTGAPRPGRRGASSEPLPQFVCRHCGKRYRWKSTLRRHESVECGGKPPTQACPYCPYRAKQRGNLGVHVRKHHNAQWGAFADTKLRKTKRESHPVKY